MMAALKDKAIVAADAQFLMHMPSKRFRLRKYADAGNHQLSDLFIALSVSTFAEYANEIRHALETKQFRILFLREDIDIDWLPDQLHKAQLPINKLLPKLLLYSDWRVPQRVINAWADGSHHTLIAHAFATKEILTVRNCALEKIELSFQNTPILCDIPSNERNNFEIDEAGSFIHWPNSDVDLDFDALLYLAKPELRKQRNAERILAEQGFGYAIAGIRKLQQLTQADIESRADISERQMRRYETEGIKPSVSTFEKLAQAHDLDLDTYLEKLACAINGPVTIIIPCESSLNQSEIANKFIDDAKFKFLDTHPLLLRRPKGSKDHDIWKQEQPNKVARSSRHNQLALALHIESIKTFEAIWSWCTKHQLAPDAAIGLNNWPSVGFISVPTDYAISRLQKTAV